MSQNKPAYILKMSRFLLFSSLTSNLTGFKLLRLIHKDDVVNFSDSEHS